MNKPTMSVIIPVGDDREANLNLVLKALSLQTYQKFEIIICCDGEAGLNFAFLERWGRRITYSWVPRQGQVNLGAENRNRGAEIATTDFFVYIDSDVMLNKDAMESYQEGFWNFPIRAICGPYHWLPPMVVTEHDVEHNWDKIASYLLPRTDADVKQHNFHPDPRQVPWDTVSPDALYCDYRRSIMMLTGNLAVHRKVFDGAGGFWEELQCGVDGAFGLSVYRSGFSWSFDGSAVGYHLSHPRTKGIDGAASMAKIHKRFHSDDTWLGLMDTRVGWHWDSKNG